MFFLPDDFVSTGVPVDQEWSSAVAPVIGINDDSLTGVSAVAELALRIFFSFGR